MKKLRRRDKRAQKHINRLRAYHKYKSDMLFLEYYENALIEDIT